MGRRLEQASAVSTLRSGRASSLGVLAFRVWEMRLRFPALGKLMRLGLR